jgi:hypothetical protein
MKWINGNRENLPSVDNSDFPKKYVVRFKGDDPRSGWVDISLMTAEEMTDIVYPDRWEYLDESESSSYSPQALVKTLERLKKHIREELMFSTGTGRQPRQGKNEAYYNVIESIDDMLSSYREGKGEEQNGWIKITEGCEMTLLGEEYNVVWDLEDGGDPVVTTMEWNVKLKKWEDHRGESTAEQRITHYRPLPKPPKKL